MRQQDDAFHVAAALSMACALRETLCHANDCAAVNETCEDDNNSVQQHLRVLLVDD
jgi:hypothetical protein